MMNLRHTGARGDRGVKSMSSAVQSFGAQMTRQARRVADARKREEWPYIHVYPPPAAVPVHLINFVAAPAAGQSAVVLAYRVPSGMAFYLQAILQNYAGGNILPGDALWTVNRNAPTGVTDRQAMPVQGLAGVPIPLGSFAAGAQWPFSRAYEFAPLDLVQSVVSNVNLGGGSFVSGFFGYLVPTLLLEG